MFRIIVRSPFSSNPMLCENTQIDAMAHVVLESRWCYSWTFSPNQYATVFFWNRSSQHMSCLHGLEGLLHFVLSATVSCHRVLLPGLCSVGVSSIPSRNDFDMYSSTRLLLVCVAFPQDKAGATIWMLLLSRDTISPLIPGLTRNGKLVVLGGTMDQIPVAPLQLIGKRRTIQGWPSGTGRDSQVRVDRRQLRTT